MGLRVRTILVFLATILLSIVVALVVSRYFYLKGFVRIEEQETLDALDRTAALIEDDLAQLDLTAQDWATWTDTFSFMEGDNPHYAETSLLKESFEVLRLSAFILLDGKGDARFLYAAHPEQEEEIVAAVNRYLAVPLSGQASGIIAAGNALHLIVLRPILRSDGSGPAVGTLVMSRVIGAERLTRYSRLLGHAVSARPAEAEEVLPPLERDPEWIRATGQLSDFLGNRVGFITIEAARAIYRYGATSLVFYLATIAMAIFGVGLASALVLEALVLRRMRALGAELTRIATDRDLSARLKISGNDEFDRLGQLMNRTLDALGERIREREFMLREIHHRVKNNLQIIASLLSLQAADTASEETEAALAEGRRRVLAMASVHEELYADPDMSRIKLQRFLDRFSRSMERGDESRGVSVQVLAGEFWVDLERAVPLGLIVSEVLSNCFRHAFPRGRAGGILIAASGLPGGGFELRVSDDGIGIPPVAERQGGLGLTLVDILAQQIGGTVGVEVRPEGGTLFRLAVPESGRRPARSMPSASSATPAAGPGAIEAAAAPGQPGPKSGD